MKLFNLRETLISNVYHCIFVILQSFKEGVSRMNLIFLTCKVLRLVEPDNEPDTEHNKSSFL